MPKVQKITPENIGDYEKVFNAYQVNPGNFNEHPRGQELINMVNIYKNYQAEQDLAANKPQAVKITYAPVKKVNNYDYKGAFIKGIKPNEDGHWPSMDGEGKWLKSPEHPTAWKEGYFQAFGSDPDKDGVIYSNLTDEVKEEIQTKMPTEWERTEIPADREEEYNQWLSEIESKNISVKNMKPVVPGEVIDDTDGSFPVKAEKMSALIKARNSWINGSYQLVDLVGGALMWSGLNEELGKNIREFGKDILKDYQVDALEKEFEWSDMANPEFYYTKGVQIIPMMTMLIPTAMGGGAGGAAIAARYGFGKLATGVTASAMSALASRPLESVMEAAGTYNELIDSGISKEKAGEAASQVFVDNLSLIGMDAAQYMAAFHLVPMVLRQPMAKFLKNGFKAVGFAVAAGAEGWEEITQTYYQDLGRTAAKGEVSPEYWDAIKLSSPEYKESFVLGFLGGAVFQAAGLASNKDTGKQSRIDKIINAEHDRIMALREERGEGAETTTPTKEAVVKKESIKPQNEKEKIISDINEKIAGLGVAVNKDGEIEPITTKEDTETKPSKILIPTKPVPKKDIKKKAEKRVEPKPGGKQVEIETETKSTKKEPDAKVTKTEQSKSDESVSKPTTKKYTIEESEKNKAYREKHNRTEIVEVDAAELQRKIENGRVNKLGWSEEESKIVHSKTRLENALKRESTDAYPFVDMAGKGNLDVADGGHRIAAAAQNGQTIEIAVRPEQAESIREKMDSVETTEAATPKKKEAAARETSKDHIGYDEEYEYFYKNKALFRAPLGNPVMPDGYRGGGRWVAPKNHPSSQHFLDKVGLGRTKKETEAKLRKAEKEEEADLVKQQQEALDLSKKAVKEKKAEPKKAEKEEYPADVVDEKGKTIAAVRETGNMFATKAQAYINKLKSPAKWGYAKKYRNWLRNGKEGAEPMKHPGLPVKSAKEVRDKLNSFMPQEKKAAKTPKKAKKATKATKVPKKKETSKTSKVASKNDANKATTDEVQRGKLPVGEVSTDTKRFQRRKGKFGKKSVENIILAVKNKTFNWAKLNDIVVWIDPADGKTYVLAGHSRLEAFTQLSKDGFKQFDDIPAKYFEGTEAEAIEFAKRESNFLNESETLLDGAADYREQRNKGVSKAEIERQAEKTEGKNKNTVIAFSYLSEDGAVEQALEAFEEAGSDEQRDVTSMGTWIGKIRERNPGLKRSHETEMFNHLKNGAYKGKFTNQVEFQQFVEAIIERNSDIVNGEYVFNGKPLNFTNIASIPKAEIEYNKKLKDARKNFKNAQQALSDKNAEINQRTQKGEVITKEQRALELAPLIEEEAITQLELDNIGKNEMQIKSDLKKQTSMFDVVDEKPPIARSPKPKTDESIPTKKKATPIREIRTEQEKRKLKISIKNTEQQISDPNLTERAKNKLKESLEKLKALLADEGGWIRIGKDKKVNFFINKKDGKPMTAEEIDLLRDKIGAEFTFESSEFEERFNEAKKSFQPSLWQKIWGSIQSLGRHASREYENLKKGQFPEFQFLLRKLAKQEGVANHKTIKNIQAIIGKLSKEDYDLFVRKVVLDDLVSSASRGEELPFGLDEEQAKIELEKLEEFLGKNGKLEVVQALAARRDLWHHLQRAYMFAMDNIGMNVGKKFDKADYYRHIVLDYARAKAMLATGSNLKSPTGRGFLKKRKGSLLDISTDYLQAETEVISQMLYDIQIAKAIQKIGVDYDVYSKLMGELDEEQKKEWRKHLPEGYSIWQPEKGNRFYIANAIPEKVANEALIAALEDIEGTTPLHASQIRKALALAGRKTEMVLPSEIAATLENLTTTPKHGKIASKVKAATKAWKIWTLISPRRYLRYNFRNTTGDLEAAIVGNPSGVKKSLQAAAELFHAFTGDKVMTENLQEWFERGGFESTLQMQEIGDVNKLKEFIHLHHSSKNLFKKGWNAYWKTARGTTDFREAILRYANYLSYKEQLDSGKLKNYGASDPSQVQSLESNEDKAFMLSNDLLGAYDRIGLLGQEIRQLAIPFWSWQEVNFKRYVQLFRNAANNGELASTIGRKLGAKTASTAFRVGKFAIKAHGFLIMLTLWNNFKHPEEEAELSDQERQTPHIIFGRDKEGNILSFNRLGTLGDFVEWFGLDATPYDIVDMLNGKKGLGEILADMALSPVNKLVQGINPFFKTPMELIVRQSFFPNVFERYAIRDIGVHLARSMALADEYKALTGKPSKPYTKSLKNLLLYSTDPMQASYSKNYQNKRQFLRRMGDDREGFYRSSKSDALYNYKASIRLRDAKAAAKYLYEYIEIASTVNPDITKAQIQSGIKKSLESMNPLAGMNSRLKKLYAESLNQKEIDDLLKAIRYYEDILLAGTSPELATEIESEFIKLEKKMRR